METLPNKSFSAVSGLARCPTLPFGKGVVCMCVHAYECDGRRLSNLKIWGERRGVGEEVPGPDKRNSTGALLPGFTVIFNRH